MPAQGALLDEPARAHPERVKGARDPAQTSAAILAAAVHEFSQKGYGGARINEIAKRAGANKRMIYHYFGGKEALYLAALECVYASIRSAEAELQLAARDPIEAIGELTRFTWRYFLAHPEFLSLLATENLHKARHLRRSTRILEMHSPLVATLADVLDRGAAEGRLRSGVDPVRVYITIASLGFFYLTNRHTLSAIFQRDLAGARELEDWGEHIAEVVLASLRP